MTLWILSLALGAFTAVAVAVLLASILAQARRIEGTTSSIWAAGKVIAGHTIHVPDLARTNHHLRHMIAAAPSLHSAVRRIGAHAAGCSGCPRCVEEG